MKTFFLTVMVIVMAFYSYGQRLPAPQAVETDYLAKGKRQNTIAWLMLAGGTGVAILGYTLWISESLNGDGVYSSTARWYLAMGYAGGACMLGSIPVFIAAARNKGMGMRGSVGIKFERPPALAPPLTLSRSFPAIAFKIDLK